MASRSPPCLCARIPPTSGSASATSLEDVPEGANVGTASLRRRAQLLAARPDLRISELRGNVDTRLRRLEESELDAIVLAAAGLRRLGRESEISFAIPAAQMTPAPGQGALVLQTRSGDEAEVAALGDETAARELTAERATVALLQASCATPVGVHARVGSSGGGEAEETLVIEAFVGLPDGSEWLRDRIEGDADQPAAVGALLAERLLATGAAELLARRRNGPGGRPDRSRRCALCVLCRQKEQLRPARESST